MINLPQVFAEYEVKIPALLPRPEIKDFVRKPGTTEWFMFGTGFDTVNNSFNAQTLTRRYVNEVADTTITTGFAPTIDFTMDEMTEEPIQEILLDIARERKVGAEAVLEHMRVYWHRPFVHAETKNIEPGFVKAYRDLVNVVISDENPRDNMLSASGQLTFVAGFILGGVDINTKPYDFTPADEIIPAPIEPAFSNERYSTTNNF